MNDFDLKGIEKYQKQLKKEMKREERAYENRRLSFEKRPSVEESTPEPSLFRAPIFEAEPSSPLSESIEAIHELPNEAAAVIGESDLLPSFIPDDPVVFVASETEENFQEPVDDNVILFREDVLHDDQPVPYSEEPIIFVSSESFEEIPAALDDAAALLESTDEIFDLPDPLTIEGDIAEITVEADSPIESFVFVDESVYDQFLSDRDDDVFLDESSFIDSADLQNDTDEEILFPISLALSDDVFDSEPDEATDFSEEPVIECVSLIAVPQPDDGRYLELSGIDNLSGRRIRSIIQLVPDAEPNPVLEPASIHTETELEADAEGKEDKSPSIIYLPGDIYKETFLNRLKRGIFNPRVAAAAIFLTLFLVPVYLFYAVGTVSYLTDKGDSAMPRKVVWTTLNSPREIASTVTELDKADRVEVEDFGSTQMLTVVRSYPISIAVDGETESVKVLDITVEDFLEQEGIDLKEEDILSLEPDHLLEEGDELVIQRVTFETREPVIETVPFQQIKKNSPILSKDREVLVRDGVDGLAERVYLDRYVDGVLESSEIIEETILEQPIHELTVTGDPTVPASMVEGSLYTDIEIVDGVPETYKSVMEDAICTAYSFGPNTFGASGMKLIQGFVATNPDVIPYGTLMYIASDRFTYGWAVAADCGTAMMEGYVDIDCYFETYDESAMFGKKLLNVYIIGQLTQSQLEDYAANGMFYGRVPKTLAPEEPVIP